MTHSEVSELDWRTSHQFLGSQRSRAAIDRPGRSKADERHAGPSILVRSPENRDPGRHCHYQVDHYRLDHSTCTCNQSLWMGDDVAPPGAERRWWIGFCNFMIVAQGLAYQPRHWATRFV
jgi:hypothetical protein